MMTGTTRATNRWRPQHGRCSIERAGARRSAQERDEIRVGCAGGETFTPIAIELGVVLESTLESCSHLALGLDHGVAAHARSLGHCRLPATSEWRRGGQ